MGSTNAFLRHRPTKHLLRVCGSVWRGEGEAAQTRSEGEQQTMHQTMIERHGEVDMVHTRDANGAVCQWTVCYWVSGICVPKGEVFRGHPIDKRAGLLE